LTSLKINRGDEKTFDSLIGTTPDPNKVIIRLNSPGGNFGAGFNMAASIYNKHLSTYVEGKASCDSICAVMWISGSTKAADFEAEIGFHNVYDSTNGQATGSGDAVLGSYLGKIGFDYKAIMWMTERGASDLNYLSSDEARELGIEASSFEDLPKPECLSPSKFCAKQQTKGIQVTEKQKCQSQGYEWRDLGPESYCRTFKFSTAG
jgi:hypothetical protein